MWLHTDLRDLGVFWKHLVASKRGSMIVKKGDSLIAENMKVVLQSLKVYL